ncbi:MAG: GAF domain-containing protein [Anaerolineae bacterium]|nr:GAF domain-containing protein [Anaerolineae bacterium]
MNLLRPLRNLQLGIKLNIVVLFVLGMLLIAILLIISSSVQNLTLQIGRQRARQETEMIQQRLIELEQNLLDNTKILASRPGLVELVASKDVANLRTAVLVGGAALNLDDISVVDETGSYLMDTGGESQNDEVSALFSLGLLGIDTVGAVNHPASRGGKPEFHHAAVVPLRDTTGRLVGSLLAEHKVDDEFLRQLNFLREDVGLMLIRNEEILAQTLNQPEAALDPVAIQQAMNGQTIITDDIVNLDGVFYIVGYMPLTVGDKVEGVMAVLLNINNLVMFERQLTGNTSFGFYGLSLAAIILLTLFIWRVVLVPIKRLQSVAAKMAGGDYESRVKVASRDEVGRLAQTFNDMAADVQTREKELRELAEELRGRTQALETITETSRRLVTILDVDQLLREVVNTIQKTFNYYHVHIYLTDSHTGELVMREGTGIVGRQLKAQGHRLKPSQGIVGQVASSGDSFLAENVDEVPNFVRNPLLPKTQAELAVPLRKGKTILGVLDMQSEEVGGFRPEDLALMQSIADQIAVAIDNARLFRQARAAAAEAEALNRRLTRETWQDIGEKVAAAGYVFGKAGITPIPETATLDETWLPIMTRAVEQKDLAYEVGDNGNDASAAQPTACLSIPLVLRDEVIGVIGIERAALSPDEGEESAEPDRSQTVAWTEDELTTIRTVVEQIALALDAARLARETERAAWRDRVVGESIAKVWATAEIEEVMKAAVSQLGDRLRASEVVIRLGKEDELLPE